MSEPSPVPIDGDVTKTRRLVPQFSLTKQDLGSDNARNARPSGDTPKKPVIRFTREQLISLRKDSRLLPSMATMPDIVSHETLSPVCFSRLEPEDVIRIYNSANREAHGRGRARGLKYNRENDSDKLESKTSDMWDDDVQTNNDTLDLAGFAEAALKFRSETKELKSSGPNEMDNAEDVVTSLFDAQREDAEQAEDVPISHTSADLDQPVTSPIVDFGAVTSSSTNLEPVVQSLFPQLNFGISSSFDIFAGKQAVEPVEWFYTDPQNQVQGPFTQETMKVWNDDGYFSSELPIKLGRWQQFHPFKMVFPNTLLAFVDVPSEPLQISFGFGSSSPVVQPDIKPSVGLTSIDLADRLLPETGSSTVDTYAQQRGSVKHNSKVEVNTESGLENGVQHNAEKSDFAKKLLGIGRKKSDPVPHNELALSENKADIQLAGKPSKGWNQPVSKSVVSLADIQNQQQQEELKKVDTKSVTPIVPVSQPVTSMSFQLKSLLGVRNPINSSEDRSKSAWTTPTSAESSSSSLKEIMNEELNRKQHSEPESAGTKPTSISWASKAKSNTPPLSQTSKPDNNLATPNVNAMKVVEKTPGSSLKSTENTRKSVDKSEFGGKTMSKDMADWCSVQLKRLKGSDEAMELLQFCMSLKSSGDIREYLSHYLGSSPQVTNFATEFIKYKDEGKRPVASEKPLESNKFQNSMPVKKKKPLGSK